MKIAFGLFACLIIIFGACDKFNQDLNSKNPASEGFDLANSDPAAVELADSVMLAMGGWENWNDTRFISWTYFDSRNLYWDKSEGRVRVESIKDSTVYVVDLNTLTGRAWIKGKEVTMKDSLDSMLKRAKGIWANDSYWLVMPFKLKDDGVRIKYLGEDTLMSGGRCNVIELTINTERDEPKGKYLVFVDLTDNLVKQWSYYSKVNQDSASFIRPWDNYKRYGGILLSSDRSDGSGPRNVAVENGINEKIFTELEWR